MHVVDGEHGDHATESFKAWWDYVHYFHRWALSRHTPLWLIGAQVAVASAVFAVGGLMVQKMAFSRSDRERRMNGEVILAGGDSSLLEDPALSSARWRGAPAPSRCPPPLFWAGLLVYLLSESLSVMALACSTVATVSFLGVVQVLTNALLSYGVLGERFNNKDVLATLGCMVGMTLAVLVMPHTLPRHLGDFPVERVIAFFDGRVVDEEGQFDFTIYLACAAVTTVLCLAASCTSHRRARSIAMPALAGLFSAAHSFLVMLFGTLMENAQDLTEVAGRIGITETDEGYVDASEVWKRGSTPILFALTFVFYICKLVSVCRGVRYFDCRYFVPTSFAFGTVLIIGQGYVFFHEWESYPQVVGFAFACCLTVTSAFCISDKHCTVQTPLAGYAPAPTDVDDLPLLELPDSENAAEDCKAMHLPLKKSHPSADSLLKIGPDFEELAVLAIMNEYGLRTPEAHWQDEDSICGWRRKISVRNNHRVHRVYNEDTGSPIYADLAAVHAHLNDSCIGRSWSATCRAIPIVVFTTFVAMVIVLFKLKYVWQAFSVMTFFFGYNCWKHGVHIAVFSNAGQMKMEAYTKVNFETLFRKMAMIPDSPEASVPMPFEQVMHFVILPNYKEDYEILKEAVMSIASCGIARGQICLVLAMEEREAGGGQKAEKLLDEIRHLFRSVVYTQHPPGIPGEEPGKSSNTRWAYERLIQEHIPKEGLDLKQIVFTVADADSEFHAEYFTALTYAYLTSPDEARYCTIWQAPVIHYKNYHSQPAVVRLASLFTSQFELANLSDPAATRFPYSTYSLSGVMAHGVDGWDPDWISEDWHMCCKCFCATFGELIVSPIFLPILNYAPEGDNWCETMWARYAQAKRHALGVSEIVYFSSLMPWLVLGGKPVGMRRRLRLLTLGSFLWFRMLMIHGVMATILVLGPLNALVMYTFYKMNKLEDLNSWTCLANVVFQMTSSFTFACFVWTAVRLYFSVAHRIVGLRDKKEQAWFERPCIHFLAILVTSSLSAPVFFIMGGGAEWIAAWKTAFTHRFDYEVALKPQLASAVDGKGACEENGKPPR